MSVMRFLKGLTRFNDIESSFQFEMVISDGSSLMAFEKKTFPSKK